MKCDILCFKCIVMICKFWITCDNGYRAIPGSTTWQAVWLLIFVRDSNFLRPKRTVFEQREIVHLLGQLGQREILHLLGQLGQREILHLFGQLGQREIVHLMGQLGQRACIPTVAALLMFSVDSSSYHICLYCSHQLFIYHQCLIYETKRSRAAYVKILLPI